MSLIPFESSWKKKAEREQLREARETILAAAEAKAEKLANRKKAENSWMLPGLDAQIESEHKSKSKKSKKDKKEKKSKKKKKKHKGSSGSSNDEDDDEWVEKEAEPESKSEYKTTKIPADNTQRDEWMDFGAYVSGQSFESKDLVREKDKKKAAKEEEDKLRREKWLSRELNPNLKAAGSSEASSTSESATSRPHVEEKKPGPVGDGGASWLKRAFKRAEEQAQREGKSIEEVAAVRWGSLDNFKKLLAKAEGGSSSTSTTSSNDRDRNQDRKRGFRRSRSRSRDRRQRSRSRSRDRRDRSRSRDRRSRSRSRDRRQRSRSRDRREKHSSDDRRASFKFSRPNLDENRSEIPFSDRRGDTKGVGNWKTQDRRVEEREKESKSRRKSESSSSSSSSDEEELPDKIQPREASKKPEEKPAPAVPILSEQELNVLGAKLVKAELLGNNELADKLKAQLAEARKARQQHLEEQKSNGGEVTEEVVVLTRTDAKGMTRPVDANAESEKGGKRRKKMKLVETHSKTDRERTKYFADDDNFDLKTMFEREKLSTAEDQNAMLSRLAGRGMETTSQEYDMDDVMVSRAAAEGKGDNDAARDRAKAISEHKKMAKILDGCKYCFGTKAHQKHLMIAIGRTCYLCLPEHASLADGHCFIVPMSHVSCAVQMDEDVYREMQEFRQALTKMFRSDEDESDCIFFESAMSLRHHPHMVLECVPLPKELGETAPMYFQKAIQESESEWSHNKKLISLRDKPLRRSVPKGLPYFHVDFGMENGFAHVIEDEQEFPKNFAQEIIGGMLDLEPRVWRHPRRESFEAQRKKVIEFGSKWKNFDFTRKNNEEIDSSNSSDEDN